MDIETAILGNQPSAAGNDTTPRKSAGMESQLFVNTVHGAGGSTPGFSGGIFAAPIDGTPAAFTEAVLKEALGKAWAEGGDPTVLMMGPKQKAAFSTFEGSQKFAGTYTESNGQATVVGAVEIYVSDFGEHKARLSRYMRPGTVFCLDPEYMSIAWLRPIKFDPRAKTGDARRGALVGEWTLVVESPDSSAKIADRTTT